MQSCRTRGGVRAGFEGEGDVEGAAPADFANAPGAAVVAFGDGFDEGEAEAGAFDVAGGALFDAVEFLEEAYLILGGDAGAIVLDADDDFGAYRAGFEAGSQGDLAAVGGVFDGVVDEVGDGLANEGLVAFDGGQGGGGFDGEVK